jgi:hypothetical protein
MLLSNLALFIGPIIVALVEGTTVSFDAQKSHLDTFGNFEDGSYQLIVSDDGTTQVTKLDSIVDIANVAPASVRSTPRRAIGTLTARACDNVGCDGIALNHGDCDRAVDGLKAQCGMYFPTTRTQSSSRSLKAAPLATPIISQHETCPIHRSLSSIEVN